MHLPGRLRTTTLGDLLGTLHRAEATGALELAEDTGKVHRVHLSAGRIAAVEFDGAAGTLGEILRAEGTVDDETLRRALLRAMASKRLHGEVLVNDFRQAFGVVDAALRRQMTARLQRLEDLPDAQVLFRVTVRVPRGSLSHAPLQAKEFLPGRRRARARQPYSHRPARDPNVCADASLSAWRVLGVTPGADALEIKRAYRKLARSCHPDLHPEATELERRALSERFAQVTTAYRSLVA